VPWNKRLASPRVIIFTCKFCGKKKPIEEMRVATRFFPQLPVCQGCWKLLEAPSFTRVREAYNSGKKQAKPAIVETGLWI